MYNEHLKTTNIKNKIVYTLNVQFVEISTLLLRPGH